MAKWDWVYMTDLGASWAAWVSWGTRGYSPETLYARGGVTRNNASDAYYVCMPGHTHGSRGWPKFGSFEDAKAALVVARVMAGLDADTGEPVQCL